MSYIEKNISVAWVLKQIENKAAQYPTDIFPDDGTSPECKAAKLVRLVCRTLREDICAPLTPDIRETSLSTRKYLP